MLSSLTTGQNLFIMRCKDMGRYIDTRAFSKKIDELFYSCYEIGECVVTPESMIALCKLVPHDIGRLDEVKEAYARIATAASLNIDDFWQIEQKPPENGEVMEKFIPSEALEKSSEALEKPSLPRFSRGRKVSVDDFLYLQPPERSHYIPLLKALEIHSSRDLLKLAGYIIEWRNSSVSGVKPIELAPITLEIYLRAIFTERAGGRVPESAVALLQGYLDHLSRTAAPFVARPSQSQGPKNSMSLPMPRGAA